MSSFSAAQATAAALRRHAPIAAPSTSSLAPASASRPRYASRTGVPSPPHVSVPRKPLRLDARRCREPQGCRTEETTEMLDPMTDLRAFLDAQGAGPLVDRAGLVARLMPVWSDLEGASDWAMEPR